MGDGIVKGGDRPPLSCATRDAEPTHAGGIDKLSRAGRRRPSGR
jgi:hypothetical protein